ncbi:MAG TPA: hypothetical protein VF658_09550 [Pyrinomonadaceae bacterium]|jgi:hypothetical protein
MKLDTTWYRTYKKSLKPAKAAAAQIYLIHVSGHFIPFEQVLTTHSYHLPLSVESAGYCSQVTREAEDSHGLNRSLYFYAGRAFPGFGPIALAFDPSCEKKHRGSATPYDTGGLYKGFIKWNLPDYTPSTLSKFTKDSAIDLKKWRAKFSTFMAAYFAPLHEYWSGRPWKDDPEQMFQPANHWRAWVFEVRFEEEQSIFDAATWCARPDQANILFEEAEASPPLGSVYSPLQDFMDKVPSLVPQGTPEYCEEIEAWVRREIGL